MVKYTIDKSNFVTTPKGVKVFPIDDDLYFIQAKNPIVIGSDVEPDDDLIEKAQDAESTGYSIISVDEVDNTIELVFAENE